jgi:PAS domain S-box-containing protein
MTTQPPSREDVPADASWAAQPIRAAELEELLVHGAAAVIATDLDGVITHWNAGAQRLYGWSGTETIGLPFLELLVAPGDRRTAEANMESIRRTGGWEGNFTLRCKSGGSLLTYTRCAVIKDDAGRLVGMLGLSMDAAAPPRRS